jgi:methionyl-tRNA synthetase
MFYRITGQTVIGVCVNIAYIISVLIYPYMPVTSLNIRKQLNIDEKDLGDLIQALKLDGGKQTPYPQLPDKFYCFIKAGHKIGKAEPLFRQIKDDEIKILKTRFAGKQDEVPVDDKKKVKKPKVKKEEKKAVVVVVENAAAIVVENVEVKSIENVAE